MNHGLGHEAVGPLAMFHLGEVALGDAGQGGWRQSSFCTGWGYLPNLPTGTFQQSTVSFFASY
jgi:hypothetical protein